jgi:predicted MFS family arabinose efflux permease
VIGLIFSAGSIGGLLGAAVASRVSRWLTIGPTIIWASFLRGLGIACVPLAALLPFGTVPLLVVAYTVHSFGWSLWAVNQGSVRQGLAPDRMRGRVTASFLFLVRSATPLGALAGGALGEGLGVTPTLVIAAVGLLSSTVWLLLSPLRHVREQPVAAV